MGRKPVMKPSCPKDHYKQHPGLQIPRVERTNTRDKRQRWGSADILIWKIGHHDDKSQRGAGELRGGGLDALYSLLCRQFNCSSHFGFAAVNCWYGNGSVLFKRRSLVDETKWKLYWMGGLIALDIYILHFMTLLSYCLHPVLTQRAHYYQWRGVDLRRHSYESCLKALLCTHSPSVND